MLTGKELIMTFNSYIIVQGMTLNWGHVCNFECVDEAMSGGKFLAGKGLDNL